MFYHVIVTHGYELIAWSHARRVGVAPHGSSSYSRCVQCQLLSFSGLRTRLTETLDGEQTVEGEQVNK